MQSQSNFTQGCIYLQAVRPPSLSGRCGERSPQPLPQLSDQPPCGRGAGRPGQRLWRIDGSHRGVGPQGWRVGYHPPLPPLRGFVLQPHGGGRQSGQAAQHRRPACGPATLPYRADGGNDGSARVLKTLWITKKCVAEISLPRILFLLVIWSIPVPAPPGRSE